MSFYSPLSGKRRAGAQDSIDHMNDSRDIDTKQALDEQIPVLELIFKRSTAEADGDGTVTQRNIRKR